MLGVCKATTFGDDSKPQGERWKLTEWCPCLIRDWMTYTEWMKHYFVANDVTDADKKTIDSALNVRASFVQGHPKLGWRGQTWHEALQRHCETSEELLRPATICNNAEVQVQHLCQECKWIHHQLRCCFKRDCPVLRVKGVIARHADRLVGGVNHEAITNHLLSEKKTRQWSAIESAECDTRQLQTALSMSMTQQVHNSTAHKPKNRQKRGSSRPAKQGNSVARYRCGASHLASMCRFINTICHAYKKRGHIVSADLWHSQEGQQGRPTI